RPPRLCGQGCPRETRARPGRKHRAPNVDDRPQMDRRTETTMTRKLVVVGAGMVAQRLVEALRSRDAENRWEIVVLGEEPRHPYDRVALTSYFSARDAEELALGDGNLWEDPLVTLRKDDRVVAIDREARTVTTARGRVEHYDHLVL